MGRKQCQRLDYNFNYGSWINIRKGWGKFWTLWRRWSRWFCKVWRVIIEESEPSDAFNCQNLGQILNAGHLLKAAYCLVDNLSDLTCRMSGCLAEILTDMINYNEWLSGWNSERRDMLEWMVIWLKFWADCHVRMTSLFRRNSERRDMLECVTGWNSQRHGN